MSTIDQQPQPTGSAVARAISDTLQEGDKAPSSHRELADAYNHDQVEILVRPEDATVTGQESFFEVRIKDRVFRVIIQQVATTTGTTGPH